MLNSRSETINQMRERYESVAMELVQQKSLNNGWNGVRVLELEIEVKQVSELLSESIARVENARTYIRTRSHHVLTGAFYDEKIDRARLILNNFIKEKEEALKSLEQAKKTIFELTGENNG